MRSVLFTDLYELAMTQAYHGEGLDEIGVFECYLRRQGSYSDQFLARLRDLRFTGEIAAVPEGTVVFPNSRLTRRKSRRSRHLRNGIPRPRWGGGRRGL